MIKRLLLIFTFALLPMLGIAQTSTPESTVKAFYTWYIPYGRQENSLKDKWPIADDKILEFIEPLAARQIRSAYTACGNTDCIGADYFTRAQNWDEKYWLNHMTISQPIYSSSKAIVAIQFGNPHDAQKNTNNHVIVILKKIGEKWMITDVADANDRRP